jgi:carboxyl-terminal processing protease
MTAFTIFGIWLGLQFRDPGTTRTSKLEQFFNYLETEYVDTLDVNGLVERAMEVILGELDPHSTYIPADEGELMAQRMQGNFQGIGIEFIVHKDTLVVLRALPKGPADKAGLEGGDRIFSVDGDTLVGPERSSSEFTAAIKGEAGSAVLLGIKRSGGSVFFTEVTRGVIPVESVSIAQMDGSIGYVRLERFAETTHEEIIAALDRLSEKGMRALILDLRDNPGGFLHEATAVADEFLGDSMDIVTTKYRDGSTYTATAQSGERFEDLPVHILINANSASASEVLAGALQDHDRAVVYGQTSFGKGLVQEDKILSDGSKVRLTVANYYTPSGRSIQRPYEGALTPGEMEGTVFYSDAGRLLHSQGGIEPDVNLQNDSTQGYFWGFGFGTMDAFAFEKVDRERSFFSSFEEEVFVQDFAVSDMLLLDFLNYGGYGLGVEDLSSGDQLELRRYLKALIAKNIWGFESYQRILLESDSVYQQTKQAVLRTIQ